MTYIYIIILDKHTSLDAIALQYDSSDDEDDKINNTKVENGKDYRKVTEVIISDESDDSDSDSSSSKSDSDSNSSVNKSSSDDNSDDEKKTKYVIINFSYFKLF